MGNARQGFDDIAFHQADIGDTRSISVTDAGQDLPDSDGPLTPGRYLVQVFSLSVATAVCWVHVGAWEKTVPLTKTAAAGKRRIPLHADKKFHEFHVRKGDSDRIGAIMTGTHTATLFITRVSTPVAAARKPG